MSNPEAEANRRNQLRRLWLQWTLFGPIIQIAVSALIRLMPSGMIPIFIAGSIRSIAFGVLASIPLAIAQSIFLQHFLPRPWLWSVATVLGTVLNRFASLFFAVALFASGDWLKDIYVPIAVVLLVYLLPALLQGLPQWLVLRVRSRRAIVWLGVLMLIQISAWAFPNLLPNSIVYPDSGLLQLAYGFVVYLISGGVEATGLVWIFGTSRAAR